MAVAYWTESMARDQDKAVDDLEEQKLIEALNGFLSHTKHKSLFGGDLPVNPRVSRGGLLSGNRGLAVGRTRESTPR